MKRNITFMFKTINQQLLQEYLPHIKRFAFTNYAVSRPNSESFDFPSPKLAQYSTAEFHSWFGMVTFGCLQLWDLGSSWRRFQWLGFSILTNTPQTGNIIPIYIIIHVNDWQKRTIHASICQLLPVIIFSYIFPFFQTHPSHPYHGYVSQQPLFQKKAFPSVGPVFGAGVAGAVDGSAGVCSADLGAVAATPATPATPATAAGGPGRGRSLGGGDWELERKRWIQHGFSLNIFKYLHSTMKPALVFFGDKWILNFIK